MNAKAKLMKPGTETSAPEVPQAMNSSAKPIAHLLCLAKQEVMEMRVAIFHRLQLQRGKLRNQGNQTSSLKSLHTHFNGSSLSQF